MGQTSSDLTCEDYLVIPLRLASTLAEAPVPLGEADPGTFKMVWRGNCSGCERLGSSRVCIRTWNSAMVMRFSNTEDRYALAGTVAAAWQDLIGNVM